MSAPEPMKSTCSLGNITKTAYTLDDYEHPQRVRYALQELVPDKLLPEEKRLSYCLRRTVGNEPGDGAQIVFDGATGVVHYRGVITCGSIWGCAICSSRIIAQRRKESSDALSRWGGSVLMGAFTVGHHPYDDIGDTLAAPNGAFKMFTYGRT